MFFVLLFTVTTGDIQLLKSYGMGPYTAAIKTTEKVNKLKCAKRICALDLTRFCVGPISLQEIKAHQEKLKELIGIKESDTGLSLPSQWDLNSDKQMQQEEQPLQVARCTKIIDPNSDDAKYVINVKQIAKFVVGLGEKVAPTDVEEGMRVGVDRTKYSIQIPLPPKIDPTVSLMTVEEKPDVTCVLKHIPIISCPPV